MFRLYCFGIGYLFGCFQTAYIISKIKYSTDISKVGSGNMGASNVTTVIGKAAGLATLLIDFLKTVLPIVICQRIFEQNDDLLAVYAGLGATIGHCFPFWLKFKGGKGVAVTVATVTLIDYKMLLLCLLIGLSSYLASARLLICVVSFCVAAPLISWGLRLPPEITVVLSAISFLILVLHRRDFMKHPEEWPDESGEI